MTSVIVMIATAALGFVAFVMGIRVGRAAANEKWVQVVAGEDDCALVEAMAAHGYQLVDDEDAEPSSIDGANNSQLNLPAFDDDDTTA